MKYLSVLACIILLFGATNAGEFGPALGGDTYVDAEDEDENFAAEDTMWATSVDDDPVREVYLSFVSVYGKTPEEIEAATLKMHVAGVDKKGNVSAYFCNSQKVEDTLTWNNKPDYNEENVSTEEIEDVGWCTWDATDILKEAAEECETCPFMIVLVAEDDASIEFTSSDGDEELQAELKFTTSDEL